MAFYDLQYTTKFSEINYIFIKLMIALGGGIQR